MSRHPRVDRARGASRGGGRTGIFRFWGRGSGSVNVDHELVELADGVSPSDAVHGDLPVGLENTDGFLRLRPKDAIRLPRHRVRTVEIVAQVLQGVLQD